MVVKRVSDPGFFEWFLQIMIFCGCPFWFSLYSNSWAPAVFVLWFALFIDLGGRKFGSCDSFSICLGWFFFFAPTFFGSNSYVFSTWSWMPTSLLLFLISRTFWLSYLIILILVEYFAINPIWWIIISWNSLNGHLLWISVLNLRWFQFGSPSQSKTLSFLSSDPSRYGFYVWSALESR